MMETTKAEKINVALKEARMAAGPLTQHELGQMCGLSENKVCRLETKRDMPTRAQAEALAAVLNRTIEELFPYVNWLEV